MAVLATLVRRQQSDSRAMEGTGAATDDSEGLAAVQESGGSPAPVSLASCLAELAACRDGILTDLMRLEAPDPAQIAGMAEHWANNYLAAGFDLADAYPELADDPLFLNWALFPDLSEKPDLEARQRRLARLAHERATARRR
jgi:hypothetical protein